MRKPKWLAFLLFSACALVGTLFWSEFRGPAIALAELSRLVRMHNGAADNPRWIADVALVNNSNKDVYMTSDFKLATFASSNDWVEEEQWFDSLYFDDKTSRDNPGNLVKAGQTRILRDAAAGHWEQEYIESWVGETPTSVGVLKSLDIRPSATPYPRTGIYRVRVTFTWNGTNYTTTQAISKDPIAGTSAGIGLFEQGGTAGSRAAGGAKYLFVSDPLSQKTQIQEVSTGNTLATISPSLPGNYPMDVVFAKDGKTFYVAEFGPFGSGSVHTNQGGVALYSMDATTPGNSTLVRRIGSMDLPPRPNEATVNVLEPVALALDSADQLYIADMTFGRILVVSGDLTLPARSTDILSIDLRHPLQLL